MGGPQYPSTPKVQLECCGKLPWAKSSYSPPPFFSFGQSPKLVFLAFARRALQSSNIHKKTHLANQTLNQVDAYRNKQIHRAFGLPEYATEGKHNVMGGKVASSGSQK